MVVYAFYVFIALPSLIWIGVGIWHMVLGRVRMGRRLSISSKPQQLSDEGIFKPALRDVTVLLTNVTDSIGLYERMGDVAASKLISRYYGAVAPAVRRNGGIVNKFIGDSVLAFFGGPEPDGDHAAEAVTTVLEIQVAMDALNTELVANGEQPLGVRIGVASGLALIGDAGSAAAADYAVRGEVVNTAGRLERLTKSTRTRNLISDVTVARLNGRFQFRQVDAVGADAISGERLFEIVGQTGGPAAQ